MGCGKVFRFRCGAVTVTFLDTNRFIQNKLIDFSDRLAIQRPRIPFLHARENLLLARRDAKQQSSLSLQLSNLERKGRAHVQEMQQCGVDRIDLPAPVSNLQSSHPASSEYRKQFPSLSREIVKTFELQNLAPQILLKTKKAASSSEGRGRFLRPLAVFAAIFLDHPRASRRAASPIGEAVSKGETVIKQTHPGFQVSFRLTHSRSRAATISKALQTRQAFDCKKL